MLTRVGIPVAVQYRICAVRTRPTKRTRILQAGAGVPCIAGAHAGRRISAGVWKEVTVRNCLVTISALPRSNTVGASVAIPSNAFAASTMQAGALVPVAEGNTSLASRPSPPSCARAVVVVVSNAYAVAIVAGADRPVAVHHLNAACVIRPVRVTLFAAVVSAALLEVCAILHSSALCTSASDERVQRVVGNR